MHVSTLTHVTILGVRLCIAYKDKRTAVGGRNTCFLFTTALKAWFKSQDKLKTNFQDCVGAIQI